MLKATDSRQIKSSRFKVEGTKAKDKTTVPCLSDDNNITVSVSISVRNIQNYQEIEASFFRNF
jgi:hypothetical protein